MINIVVDELMGTSASNICDEANVISEIRTPEEKISAPETLDYSSSSSNKDLAATNSIFAKEDFLHSLGTSLYLSHPDNLFLFCSVY